MVDELRDEACPMCGRRPNARLRKTLVAVQVSWRYRNDWGAMVPDRDGQWVHVQDLGVKGWALDQPLPLPRPREVEA